jgi:hypothetical protein
MRTAGGRVVVGVAAALLGLVVSVGVAHAQTPPAPNHLEALHYLLTTGKAFYLDRE